jgi:hypothetical protein
MNTKKVHTCKSHLFDSKRSSHSLRGGTDPIQLALWSRTPLCPSPTSDQLHHIYQKDPFNHSDHLSVIPSLKLFQHQNKEPSLHHYIPNIELLVCLDWIRPFLICCCCGGGACLRCCCVGCGSWAIINISKASILDFSRVFSFTKALLRRSIWAMYSVALPSTVAYAIAVSAYHFILFIRSGE